MGRLARTVVPLTDGGSVTALVYELLCFYDRPPLTDTRAKILGDATRNGTGLFHNSARRLLWSLSTREKKDTPHECLWRVEIQN